METIIKPTSPHCVTALRAPDFVKRGGDGALTPVSTRHAAEILKTHINVTTYLSFSVCTFLFNLQDVNISITFAG